MEMAAAATTAASTTTLSTMTASSSPPANMPRALNGNDGCLKNDVVDGLAFEIKTRRDQGNSTYSPVKVSKLFHRHMKNKARQVSHSNDCRELSSAEFQHFQNSMEKSSLSSIEAKPLDHTDKDNQHSTSCSNGIASQAASLDLLNTSSQKRFIEKNGKAASSPGVESKEIDKKLETRLGNVANDCNSDLSKVNISLKENDRFFINSQPLFKQVFKQVSNKSENDSFSNGSLEEQSTLFVRKFMKDRSCHHRHSVGEPNQALPHTNKPLALCYKCQTCRKETLKSGCASDSEVAVGLRTSLDLGNWRVVGCRCGELCKEECGGEVVLSKGESQHKAILQNLDDDQKKALLTEKVIPCPNTDPAGYNVLDSLKPCSDAIFLFESNSKKSSPSSIADGDRKVDKQSQLRGSLVSCDNQNYPYKQQHNLISHKKNCKKTMKSSPPSDLHSSSGQSNKSYKDVMKTHTNSENKLSKSFLKLFPSAANKKPDPNQAADQSRYDGKQSRSSPSSQVLNVSQTSCSSDLSSDSSKDKNRSFTSWDNSGILYTGENFDMPLRKEKSKANRFFIKPKNHIVPDANGVDKMASASPAYVLEDKDFEHRYRLYYDDEAKVSLNMKRAEPERGNCLLSMRTSSCDSEDGNQPYLMMQPNVAVITLSSKDDSDKRKQFPQSNPVAQCFISGVGSKPSQSSGDRGQSLNSFGTQFGQMKSGFVKSGAQSNHVMFTSAQSENKSSDNSERSIPECIRRNDVRHQTMTPPSPCDVQNLTASYSNSQGNSPTNTASQGRMGSTAIKLDGLKHQEASVQCPASSYNDGAYDESCSYKPKKSYMPGCSMGSGSGETQLKTSALEGESSQKNITTFHQAQPSQLTKSTQSAESSSCPPMLNIHKSCNVPMVNGHSFNGRQMPPETYPSRTRNDLLAEPARHEYTRTNSPMDFFSILPYNDYTLANKSSDSGTLVPSESDSQGTLKNEQIVLRAAPERRSRNKVLVNITKPRKADCRESPTSTTIIETFNGAEPYLNKHTRKSKQDGVILRTPDHKTFQPQGSRNGDEAAMCGTFDPAYVPYYPSRPLSHPHVDNNHRHHGRKESRHMSYHEYIRRSPNPLGIDSTFIPGSHRRSELHPARNSCDASSTRHSPSSISLSSNGCRYGNSPSCSESPHDQVPHPTPDLLPLTTSKESPGSASKEPSVKKGHSFLSRLTHSPMSFFTRDSKSSSAPK